jgi:hypothetical protein
MQANTPCGDGEPSERTVEPLEPCFDVAQVRLLAWKEIPSWQRLHAC